MFCNTDSVRFYLYDKQWQEIDPYYTAHLPENKEAKFYEIRSCYIVKVAKHEEMKVYDYDEGALINDKEIPVEKVPINLRLISEV